MDKKKELLKNPKVLQTGDVSGFLSEEIYLISPFNNHVRFSKLYPNIEQSRKYIEFLKADPNSNTGLICDFVADFKWDGDSIVVERSDYGQHWITSILIERIKLDSNYQ